VRFRSPHFVIGYLQSDIDRPTGIDLVVRGEGGSWAQAFRDADCLGRRERERIVTA